MNDVYAERTRRMRERLAGYNMRYAELIGRAESPDIQDAKAMVRGIARQVAQDFGASAEDFIQEGTIALWEARQTFDPEHGASLATYARPKVRAAILRALNEEYAPGGVSVPHRTAMYALGERDEGIESPLSADTLQRALLALEPAMELPDGEPKRDSYSGADSTECSLVPDELYHDGREDWEESTLLIDLSDALAQADLDRTQEIILHLLGTGCTDEEIAQRLGTHRTTITRKKESALQELRRHMKEEA